MRLRELSLLAYGPFSGTTLDLSASGLHVVYGRNEAGKSTALRAVKGLFFGIDPRTGDAHVHAMKDLRIAATLEGEDGRLLRVVRRKGAANTLLDPQGKAIDEAPLARMLGGANVQLFEKMFGLDHESLREGGEALALGQGDVGESLFGASLGPEVHDVLRALRKEEDEVFAAAPNATRPPLNAALRAFADAQKKVRALSDSQAILVQQQGLEEALADRATCENEKREAAAEAARVRRARDVVPLLAKRAVIAARRRDLGDVPMLPESAARDRAEAQRERVETATKSERTAGEIDALERSRRAVVVPAAIDDADVVEALQHRLGAHRTAKEELSRVRSELAGLEDEARALAGRTRASRGSGQIDPAAAARTKKLAMQHAGLDERLRRAERDVASKARELEELRASLAEHASSRDPSALRAAIARVQPRGDVDQRLRDAEADLRARGDAAQALLAALGLFAGTLEEARALPVPQASTVERFAQRAAQAERAALRVAEQRQEIARRLAQSTRDVDALRRAADVPTEEGLAAARARRDDAWRKLRAAFTDAAARGYEPLVAEADAVADRLRREADRVARLAGLEAERASCAAEEERAQAEAATAAAEHAKVDEEWHAAWAQARIVPLSPEEMRAWLERHARVRAAAESLRTAQLERERLASDAAELCAVLLDALGEAPRRSPSARSRASASASSREDVASLLGRATEEERALAAAAQARAESERALVALERGIAVATRERDEHASALASWREAWAREVVALGVPAEATPEEATAIADDLAALSRTEEEARRIRRRASALEADDASFAAEVARLAAEHASDVAGQPVAEVAAVLVRRHGQRREARAELRRIDALVAEKRAALAELADRGALADARLDALRRAARAGDLESLERAERASADARALDAQLLSIDERLVELGEDPRAPRAAPSLDEGELEARADELAARLDELDQRHRALERTIGGLETGLAAIRKESAAAQAAAEAQEHLARVRALADRWARVRIAQVLLSREIERYRERHQAPVLARAGAFFSRMTLGAFSGLRVGYGDDDQPMLLCLRARPIAEGGDVEAGVVTLSDGTRDQLYLSLRLATLERYTETCAPLPLVVDDILVHFDDERARAALEVLAEVAGRMQILLFTHHARVVDLAQAAGRGAVHVHALSPGGPALVTSPSC